MKKNITLLFLLYNMLSLSAHPEELILDYSSYQVDGHVIKDSSGYYNDGLLSNVSISYNDEIKAKTLKFNDKGSYVFCTQGIQGNRISFLFKTNLVNKKQALIHNSGRCWSGRWARTRYYIGITKKNKLQIVLGSGNVAKDNSSSHRIESQREIKPDQWIQVELFISKEKIRLCLDGKIDSTINNDSSICQADYFIIGAIYDDYSKQIDDNPVSCNFSGEIANIKIWDDFSLAQKYFSYSRPLAKLYQTNFDNDAPVLYSDLKTPTPLYSVQNTVFFVTNPVAGHMKANRVNGIHEFFYQGIDSLLLKKSLLEEENISNVIFIPKRINQNAISFCGKDMLSPNVCQADIKKVTTLINKYLEIFPQGNIYMMLTEVDGWNFGKWDEKIAPNGKYTVLNSILLKDENITSGPAEAHKKICQKMKVLFESIRRDVHFAERFHIVIMACDGLFELQSFYDLGTDIVINKNIERQNINIVVANARGTASAYGKEYGFDVDCWFKRKIDTYAGSELNQILEVYFQSGGKYIYPEFICATPYTGNGNVCKYPTELGRVWLDFIRKSRLHPELGSHEVKIAFMRSYGKKGKEFADHWKMNKDYILFETVFPYFYDSTVERLATGTPYGPVDIVPHTIPLNVLKNYSIAIFLGSDGFDMDETVYGNLKAFVENGGILIMPLGQMRKADGNFLKKDMKDFLGIELNDDKSILKNDKFIRHELGKGYIYTVMDEYLTGIDKTKLETTIREELENVKWLTFSPGSDYLEYMVQKKGDCYILPIFNHGNIGFPSGNGRKTGTWSGKITLDLSKFELPENRLAVYESIYVPDEKIPYKLVKIDSIQENGKLSFDIKIDKFSEIVIGPADKVEENYFYKK